MPSRGGAPAPPVSSGYTGFHALANEANDALGWDLGAEGSLPGPWGNRMGDLIEDHNKRLAVLIDPQTALSAVKADNGKCQAFDTRAIWEGVAQCGYILTKELGDPGFWCPGSPSRPSEADE